MWLCLAVVLYGVLWLCGGDELPPGHLQPLGSHREPELVATLSAMPTSRSFYLDYVQTSTPVLLKGVLNSTTLLKNWGNDEYVPHIHCTMVAPAAEGVLMFQVPS